VLLFGRIDRRYTKTRKASEMEKAYATSLYYFQNFVCQEACVQVKIWCKSKFMCVCLHCVWLWLELDAIPQNPAKL